MADNPILAQTQSASQSVTSDKLLAVQEALDISTKRTAESIQKLETSARQSESTTAMLTSAIDEATAAALITAEAQNAANLQAQNRTIEAFQAAGGSDMQVMLMETLKEDSERVATLLDERQAIVSEEHTGIQFIDGIINSFSSFQTDMEIGAARAQQNQTINQIQNISAATESIAQTNALTKETLNDASIEASYKAIQAEGKIKASEAELKNIASNANAVAQLAAADARNVQALTQVYRLEGEAAERELAKERQVFAREQMNFAKKKWEVELPTVQARLEKLQLEIDDAKDPTRKAALEATRAGTIKQYEDLLATEETLVSAVQRAQAATGVAIEDRETILFGFKQSGIAGARYNRLLEIGGSTDIKLGENPFDARNNLALVSPSGVHRETSATRVLDQITSLQAEKYKQPGAKPPKDPKAIEADYNQTAKELMDRYAADVRFGDSTNPYQAPPMDTLATNAAVQQDTLYRKVLAPMAMKETNPQKIVEAAIAGIQAKTITPEQAAAGISNLFSVAAAHNNTIDGGLRRLGLPSQTSYNTQIKRTPTQFEELKRSATLIPSGFKAGVIGLVSKEAGAKSLVKDITQSFDFLFTSVDLMDTTKVQKLIVEMMANTKPAASAADADANPSTTPTTKTDTNTAE